MRLHSAKVPQIAAEMVGALVSAGDIETESPKEVSLDIGSVLNQYIRDEQEVSAQAKEMVAARGLPQTEYSRIRKLVAEERKIKLGEDAIDYLLDQLVEMLMHSGNVDEIFAEDFVLRRKMRDPLRRQFAEDEEIEQQIRGQLKHVQEGSSVWEVEYRRMTEEIKRRKGL
ncbi:MAG TPA: DUF507 family protein [Polyangiaceae bacterium]|nr:DUF507 family protein [Polyangiaceae bacterium]